MGRAALWHIVWDSRNACYQLSEQTEQGTIPAKIPGCATRGDSGPLRAGGSRSRRVRVTLCDSLDHLTGPEHHRNAGLGSGAGAIKQTVFTYSRELVPFDETYFDADFS